MNVQVKAIVAWLRSDRFNKSGFGQTEEIADMIENGDPLFDGAKVWSERVAKGWWGNER